MDMQLKRRETGGARISLVPMIDVLLILLVFFMVTSTYLNLDMIPMVERNDEAPAPSQSTSEGTTLLVRISSDGQVYVRGRVYDDAALSALIKERLGGNALLSVVLLPSTRARTQDLVATMDTLTTAGATRVRLMQLEARE